MLPFHNRQRQHFWIKHAPGMYCSIMLKRACFSAFIATAAIASPTTIITSSQNYTLTLPPTPWESMHKPLQPGKSCYSGLSHPGEQ